MSLVVVIVVVVVAVDVAKEKFNCNNRQDRANFFARGRIGQLWRKRETEIVHECTCIGV